MDELLYEIQPIQDHILENAVAYGAGGVVALILIVLLRKWSIPLILYAIEYSIYLLIMHSVVHVFTRLTAWFRNSSSMKALRPDGMPVDAVEWTTPLYVPWKLDRYDPEWVVYVELAFAVVILALMAWFRPMKTQKVKPRYGIDGRKLDGKGQEELAQLAARFGRDRYRIEFQREEELIRQQEKSRKK